MTAARHKAVVEHATRPRLIPAGLLRPIRGLGRHGHRRGVSVGFRSSSTCAERRGRSDRYVEPDVTGARRPAAERDPLRPGSLSRRAPRAPVRHRRAPPAQEPSEKAKVAGDVEAGLQGPITGETVRPLREVVLDKKPSEVSGVPREASLSPKEEPADGSSSATPPPGNCIAASPPGAVSARWCLRGGLRAFPRITTYGGWRGDGEHSDGPRDRHHGLGRPRLAGG